VRGKESKRYLEIYEQFLKDGDRVKARKEIGEIVGKSEKPSGSAAKDYEQYYGDDYVRMFGKGKP